jgi:hypothetical protein
LVILQNKTKMLVVYDCEFAVYILLCHKGQNYKELQSNISERGNESQRNHQSK